MSDGEIRDQLMTLLMAGHETTATGLAWTLDLLVRHPQVLERARDGSDAYLKAVVSESLRLRPVVPLAGRRLTTTLEVDGLALPAGRESASVSSGTANRRPASGTTGRSRSDSLTTAFRYVAEPSRACSITSG